MVAKISEEAFMGNFRVAVLALCIMLGLSPLAGFAQEELFDTQAASGHMEKGVAHLKAKKIDAAIREFEAAAEIAPDAEAYYFLGYAYYLKGRAGDSASRALSRENFELAYAIDPNFSPSRFKPSEPNLLEGQQEPEQEPAEPAPTAPQPAASAEQTSK
jgi:tetratricopeptide (TPR) repeat protein